MARTPEEHLTEAEEILDGIKRQVTTSATGRMNVTDAIALAVAYMQLALARNAVPLLGDVAEGVREDRDFYRRLHGGEP